MFAGGCFWCMEADFEKLPGVTEVVSGFTGGSLPNPTYRGNHEGHYEAVRVSYDPGQVSYEELLDHFWHNVDPFDGGGQFCDRGPSYRTAIFATPAQMAAARASRDAIAERFPDREIATEVLPAARFWPVEEYHQDYAEKNPVRYRFYRWNCGRDQRLEQVWGEAPH
jgi:peptide-methionine (S)-S-oxide reductase